MKIPRIFQSTESSWPFLMLDFWWKQLSIELIQADGYQQEYPQAAIFKEWWITKSEQHHLRVEDPSTKICWHVDFIFCCSRVTCLRWICWGEGLTCFFYRFLSTMVQHLPIFGGWTPPKKVTLSCLGDWVICNKLFGSKVPFTYWGYSDSMAWTIWVNDQVEQLAVFPWKKWKNHPKIRKMSSKHPFFSGVSCWTSGEYSFTQCSGHLWSQCFSQTVLIPFRGGLALWWN